MIDFTPIVQPIITVLGIVITALLWKAVTAFEARTGIQLTDQQRAIVLGSIQTAVGKVETKLDQKILSVGQVTVDNPTVKAEAASAIAAVPDAAAALGMTVDGVARMIVGHTSTSEHGDVPIMPAVTRPAMVPS
jgi:hypothetical protein